MKKYYLLGCLAFFCSLSSLEILPEVKVGYFIPTDAQFRTTYAKDGFITSLESSVRGWGNFFPWASVGYYEKWGHSVAPRTATHLYFVPVGLGLKYLYSFDRLSVYGGLGALPTYLHIRDQAPFQGQSKWGCGGIVKAGVIADRLWKLFFDFFVEYAYIDISTSRNAPLHPAVLSHFSIGGGIGYHFGGRSSRDQDE